MPLSGKIIGGSLGPPVENAALKSLETDIGAQESRRIMQLFTASLNDYCDKLLADLAAQDLSQTKKTAHGLKGLCMQFGATHGMELARLLELDVDNVEEAKLVLSKLVVEVARVEKFISSWNGE